MTPSGHIRRDLRSDNRGGLRITIEDVEHILPLTAAPCLFGSTGSGMTPLYDPDPGPLLYGAPRRRTGQVIASRDDGDETPHLMITVYPDHAYLARKDEVREVWYGALDICKVVRVKVSEVAV